MPYASKLIGCRMITCKHVLPTRRLAGSEPSHPRLGMCPPSTGSSGDSAVLLAAAAAAPSGRGIACGIVVAAVSQLGWGCYPVFARALQTQV